MRRTGCSRGRPRRARTQEPWLRRWKKRLYGENPDAGNGGQFAVIRKEDGALGEERGGKMEGVRRLHGVRRAEMGGHPTDGPSDLDQMEAPASGEQGLVSFGQDSISDPVWLDERFEERQARCHCGECPGGDGHKDRPDELQILGMLLDQVDERRRVEGDRPCANPALVSRSSYSPSITLRKLFAK